MSAGPGREDNIHATCVEVAGRGVLITGKSGAGKSTLALQLIDTPGFGAAGQWMRARLVADDRVILKAVDGHIEARAVETLRGLLEVRGVGLVRFDTVSATRLALVVELRPSAAIDRLGGDERHEVLGLSLPKVAIDAHAPGAAARVRAALCHVR